jgi:hypothetical protein
MPGAVAPDEQLEWERRVGRTAGIAAIAAGVLLLLQIFYPALVGARIDSVREFARYTKFHDNPDLIAVPYAMQAIGYLLAAVALWYLARATVARRSDMGRPMQIMAVVGPVANAIAAILLAFAVLDLAGQLSDLNLTDKVTDPAAGLAGLVGNEAVAEDAIRDLQTDSGLFIAAGYIDLASNLALGFGLVLVGLNAMRAGLLNRFLGILAIVVGVLTVLFRGAGIIEAFWLVAVGVLFLDRWPNGRGPAWGVVEAIPWPSAADQRAALEADRQEHVEDEPEEDEPEEYEEDEGYEEDEDEEPAATPHPASKKRKKKRRR